MPEKPYDHNQIELKWHERWKDATFYKAEDYHQNYYRDNPYQPYCLMIIDPKMRKLRKEFGAKLQDASSA